MKRSFKLLLCIIAIAALLVSCELPMAPSDTHGHAFVDANNDNVCDTCNSDGAATHGHVFVDANGDEICDTCNTDGTATHGHAFVDANDDGVCDTCATAAHVHTFESTWTTDENKHWHAATCDHSNEKKDEGDHELNELGICEVCEVKIGEPDLSTIDKAIAFANAMAGKVVNGVIVQNGSYFGVIIEYAFGDDFFYTNEMYTENVESPTSTEIWFSTDAAGEIFGVERSAYGIRRMTAYDDSISLDNLKGYTFNYPVSYGFGSFNGIEALIDALYTLGAEDYNADFESSIEDGVFAFSFGYYEDGDLYVVEADFTLDEELYIKTANVKVTSYGSDDYTVVPAEGDGFETYVVNDGAEGYVRFNYSVEQNVEDEITNEYPADEVIAESFKIVDADGNEIGEVVNALKGQNIYLYLADVLPETAIHSFISVSAAGDSIDSWMTFVDVGEDASGEWAIVINSQQLGNNEITLTINGVEATFTLAVTEEAADEVIVNQYDVAYTDWWGDSVYEGTAVPSVITVYEGNGFIYLAGLANKGSNNATVATVNGEAVDTSVVFVEGIYGYDEIPVVAIDTAAPGEYVIVFTSEANSELSATVTVNVKALPDFAELLNGKYVFNTGSYNKFTVTFSPEDDGATNGVMELEELVIDNDGKLVVYKATYNYAWGEDGFETEFVKGYDIDAEVVINESTDYKLTVDGFFALVEETVEISILGEWFYYEYNMITWEKTLVSTITFYEGGKGVYKAEGVEYYFNYEIGEYDAENWYYPITITDDADETNVGTTTSFGATATVTLSDGFINVDNGEIDEEGWNITYGYSKATPVAGYACVEIGNGTTNVYADEVDGLTEFDLILNANEAGTYVIYVTLFGETAPITDPTAYSFVIGGFDIVGALTYVVEDSERVVIAMKVPAEYYDYDVHVIFTPAETEGDDGEGGEGGEGGEVVTPSTETLTIVIGSDGYAEQPFTPAVSGEYQFASNDLAIMSIVNGTTPVPVSSNKATLEAGVTYAISFFSPAGAGTFTVTVTAPAGDGDGDSGVVAGKDANGLGGEYTFNFVMPWYVTFTPESDGASAGTISWTDIDGQTFNESYTIVDGGYVVESGKCVISQDLGGNWLFQAYNMASSQVLQAVE